MTRLASCKLRWLRALEADEARHNRLLVAMQWSEVKQREFKAWSLGAPGQCALMTSPGGQIVLGDADEQQCRGLAEETLGLDYRAVEGPDQTATWFSQRAVELRLLTLACSASMPCAKGLFIPARQDMRGWRSSGMQIS